MNTEKQVFPKLQCLKAFFARFQLKISAESNHNL